MRRSKVIALMMTWALMANLLMPILPMTAGTGSRSAADVTVDSIDLSSKILFIGDNITIIALITNLGTENATNVTVSFEVGNLSLSAPIDLGTNNSIGNDNGGANISDQGQVQVSTYWNTSELGFEAQTGLIYSINVTASNATDGNTSNNIMRVQVQFLNTHYLVINSITPSSTRVSRGAPLNLSWEVANIGNLQQPVLGDTLYLWDDVSSQAINSTAISGLASHDLSSGTFDLDTSALSLGNHTYKLVLFNSKRNLTSENITITFPNLYVGEITWEPANGMVGDEFTINATIHNNGTSNATDVYVAFFVDAPYITEAANDTVDVNVGEINVSTFVWNTTGLSPRNHTVKVSLEPTWPSENKTANITLEAGGKADLSVISVTLIPDTADIGDEVNITTTIKNIGNWPSEATNVSFRYVKGLNSSTLGISDISKLDPGQTTEAFLVWNTTGLEGWNYDIWVQVDPEESLDEDFLVNNKGNASLTLNAKPDLSITSINMTVGQNEVMKVSQGEAVTLNIVIQNIGTKNSQTTRAAIFLDASITPLKSLRIFGLAVGGRYILQYLWDSTSASIGNHTFKVVADTDENNTEIHEDNNELEFPFTVAEPKGLPDLIVDSLYFIPAKPKIGDHVDISTTLKNIGTADAINASLLFAYSTPGGPIDIKKVVIPLIIAGDEVIRTVSWATGTLSSGNYEIVISADPLNEIREIDRDNNIKTISLFLDVSGTMAGYPNLNFIDISLSKEKPQIGDTVKITVQVQNTGDGDASNVRVVFYVDQEERETQSLTLITSGATSSLTFEWKARSGMHELKVEAYLGTSPSKDDQISKVVKVKDDAQGTGLDLFSPVLILLIILMVVAIALMMGGGSKRPKQEKGFIEEDHEDEEE